MPELDSRRRSLVAFRSTSVVGALSLPRPALLTAACLALSTNACGYDRLLPIPSDAEDELPPPCADAACSDATSSGQLPSLRVAPVFELVDDTPRDSDPREPFCTSAQQDVDDATAAESGNTLYLWSPSGELYDIALRDCVSPAHVCGGTLAVRITGVASDEAGTEVGDIVDVGCEQVSLRAKRIGADDGRTYTIHFRASDEWGHSANGVCYVVVAHDNGSEQAVRGPEQYWVDAPLECPAE